MQKATAIAVVAEAQQHIDFGSGCSKSRYVIAV